MYLYIPIFTFNMKALEILKIGMYSQNTTLIKMKTWGNFNGKKETVFLFLLFQIQQAYICNSITKYNVALKFCTHIVL